MGKYQETVDRLVKSAEAAETGPEAKAFADAASTISMLAQPASSGAKSRSKTKTGKR